MIKTVLVCDRCGTLMAQLDASGPMVEDRVIELAEKCGHLVDVQDLCRSCRKTMGYIAEDEITKEIIVPSEYRRNKRLKGGRKHG